MKTAGLPLTCHSGLFEWGKCRQTCIQFLNCKRLSLYHLYIISICRENSITMMMGKEMEESSGKFWLPDDFLSDDFFVDKNDGGGGGGDGSNMSSPESEAEVEYLARLTQKMALSFLLQDGRNSGYSSHCYAKNSVMGTSPQSTLCGMGGWPYFVSGSAEGPSQVSSPPSSPFPPPQREIDAVDLLYAAAGQVARMRLHEQEFRRRGGVLTHPRSVIQQQLQAARFSQLRRQQLLKQQWAQQWARHQRSARANDEMGLLGLSNSEWPPLQKQHHILQPARREPAARPVLLNGIRRESKGTGVFLPRQAGTTTEPRTKHACSPVLLPARVVQALKLNLDDVTVNPSVPGTFLIDQDTLIARGNAMQAQEKRHPAHNLRLPREWSY